MRKSDADRSPPIAAAGDALPNRWRRVAVPPSAIAVPAAVAVACYLGAVAAAAVAPGPGHPPMLRPAGAILLAALVLSPVPRWWLLLAAALPAHLLAELPRDPLGNALAGFAGHAAGAVAGAAIVRSADAGHARMLASAHSVAVFCAAAVTAAFIAWIVEGAVTRSMGLPRTAWPAWPAHFHADLLAHVALAPAIVTWLLPGAGAERERRFEAACLLAAVLGVAVLVFAPGAFLPAPAAVPYLFVPLLLWAALRFGPRITSLSFALVVLAMFFASGRNRAFAQDLLQDADFPIHLPLLALGITLMFLAALSESLRSAQEENRSSEEWLSSAFHGSPGTVAISRHVAQAASLTGFSGALAHEVNQPLAAILSNAQAALRCVERRPPDLSQVPEILRDIVAASKHASGLVNSLRLLTRNDAEHFSPLDLNAVVLETVSLIGGEALVRQVKVRVQTAPQLPPVEGDAVQLHQVLMNLVLNAFEAMDARPPGQRTLVVSTRLEGDGNVRLAVADSGPGIPPDQLPRIFDPFYTTKATGMGLGLPICRKILVLHGGKLSVDSRVGEGTTFICTLPARK